MTTITKGNQNKGCVSGRTWTKLNLDRSAGVLMKPLLDVNLVCPLTSPNPRLVSHHFHLATPLVHQFDHPVSAENPNERDSAEDDAAVDVGHLASLKVVVALEEDAVLQQGTVQLGRLGGHAGLVTDPFLFRRFLQ